MDSLVDQAKKKIAFWVEHHKHAVLYDDQSSSLLDVTSGRSIPLRWRNLKAFEEKIHPETKDTYLVLLFDNGNQIALVDPGGVAFAPSLENTGPIRDLPAVVSLRDFHTLKQRVDHYLYDHPDEAPPREVLDLIMVCLATLDGARAVGFEVGDFERELENSLNEVERRTG